jgi:hypothetical protein
MSIDAPEITLPVARSTIRKGSRPPGLRERATPSGVAGWVVPDRQGVELDDAGGGRRASLAVGAAMP